MQKDILFRHVQIFDGTGSEPFIGDLYVEDGQITQIGESLNVSSASTIEGDGLALMPGIIDSHTHFDAQVTWDSNVSPSPEMGVTTAVIGNCGFTLAPCRPSDRDLTLRNLTQVEGMSIDVLRQGVHWNFETFGEFQKALKQKGTLINVASYLGHSSVRTFVMGQDATKRQATAEEIEQMADIVRDAMAHGAIGFASSTSPAHNGDGGLPMPSRLASELEFEALVGAMGESGRGVFMLTKGGQTPIAFLEGLAAHSGRPVFVAALLHNSTNPEVAINDLDAIAAANARGHRMMGQVSCCPLTMDFKMSSPYPLEGLESWKPALGLDQAKLKSLLSNQEFRNSVRTELSKKATFRLFNGEWSKVSVVEVAFEKNRGLEHQSIEQIARATGRDPLDVFFDLAIEEDLQTVFVALLLNSDEDGVGRLIKHPYSLVSLSDAGAHLTFFNDAGFGLYLMGHWARDLGVLRMEEAIHQLTGVQAKALGLKGRGYLRPGYAADLMLFEPNQVGRGAKRKVADLPGGNTRLHTDPLGVRGVWVNGQQIVGEHGLIPQGRLPGQLLQDFSA